jgi:hypothetical protein
MGVKGLIAAGIPVTASEVAALPVMATEGYGIQRMAPERLRLFQKLEGCHATLIVPSEHTPPWLRPRPVVIIPHTSQIDSEDDPGGHVRLGRPIGKGDRVRAVRAPRAGEWGAISAKTGDRQIETPSGVTVTGVEVRFSARDAAWLPYLNLERIVCT